MDSNFEAYDRVFPITKQLTKLAKYIQNNMFYKILIILKLIY